jgi:hypothetical protein
MRAEFWRGNLKIEALEMSGRRRQDGTAVEPVAALPPWSVP